MIFSHANLENKNQLVLELLEEVTKNGNKLSILTDELKSILEDLANLAGPEYHQVKLITYFCCKNMRDFWIIAKYRHDLQTTLLKRKCDLKEM